ncbi:MAG: tryptophan 7-halogenase [Sphingomonadales bacterium]|nr:tryptophan 7-halogenase [Sphingomonadales bacterium]
MSAAPDERAFRSIAVAGAGIVGLSAALAFARALPWARVELVETAPEPAALADRMPGTLPPVGRFHAAIGLDELDLVRRGIAVHRLGTRFEHWSADGRPWYHVNGEYGFSIGPVGFGDLWPEAERRKRARPFHRYSPAAMIAEADKFVHPEERAGSPLATYLYALALDPDGYRARLEEQAVAARIVRTGGELLDVERRQDGGLAALRLSGDRRVEGELFLDCTGPSARLIGAVDDGFEDWGAWLPADRIAVAEDSGEPSPVDVASATPDGWRWRGSAGRRTLRAELTAGGDGVAIRPGRRPRPFARNVLALGDAATAVDPLHGANLDLAQSAILRALELLPGRDCHPIEVAEYNRRSGQETSRVRDFLALHYLRSGRAEGDFWRDLADRAPPDSLAHTLEQFEARGRLPFYEEETFDKSSWLAALLGLGVRPRHLNPAAAGFDPEQAMGAMEAYAGQLAALPPRLPPYRDYLARMAGLATASRPPA